MKIIPISLILLLSIFSAFPTNAQQKQILSIEGIGGANGDGFGILTDNIFDDGFIFSFHSRSSSGNIPLSCGGSRKIAFRKYNEDGTIDRQWCRDADIRYAPYAYPQPDSSHVYFGTFYYDFLLEKITNTGSTKWRREFGGSEQDVLISTIPTSDDGFVLLGRSTSADGVVPQHPADSGKQKRVPGNIWFVKTDSNGLIKINKVIGGSDYDGATDIANAPGGGYYIVGQSKSSNYDCNCDSLYTNYLDAYIARLDKDANIIWSKCMGALDGDVHTCAATEDKEGGVYFVSNIYSGGRDVKNGYKGMRDIWVVHLDSNGNELLNQAYGSAAYHELATDIAYAADNTIWVTGSTKGKGGDVDTGYGGDDAWVFNIDEQGKIIYSKVLGGPANDAAGSVYALKDSTVLVSGHYFAPATSAATGFLTTIYGASDAFIAKFGIPKNNEVKEYQKEFNAFKLYPNPSTNNLHIEADNNAEYKVIISGITGNVFLEKDISDRTSTVDVTNWPNGVYIFKALKEGNVISIQRFVKL